MLNANVVVVAQEISAGNEFVSAWGSLEVMLLAALFYSWGTNSRGRKNYTIPLVLSWASLGVYVELLQPQDSISNTFDERLILYFQYAALGLAIGIVVVQLIAVLLHWRSGSSSGVTGTKKPSITALELTGSDTGKSSAKETSSATNYVRM